MSRLYEEVDGKVYAYDTETQETIDVGTGKVISPNDPGYPAPVGELYISPKAQEVINIVQGKPTPSPKAQELINKIQNKPSNKAQEFIDIIEYRGAENRGVAPTIEVGVRTGTTETILNTPAVKRLKREEPKLYNTLKTGGVEAFNNAVASEVYVGTEENKQFIKKHTQLKDGWISNDELKIVKEQSPTAYELLKSGGFSEYYKFVKTENERIAAENESITRHNTAVERLKPYTASGVGPKMPESVDVLRFIRENKDNETVLKEVGYKEDEIKQWQKAATDPRYLGTLYQALVRTKRNELLKTTKLERLETGTDFAMRVDGLAQAKAYKEFSPTEREAISKERFIAAEGLLIPGVETAAHWAYLSTPEKAVAVGVDVATVALMLWGGKVVAGGLRKVGLSNVGKLERLAVKAGKAGVQMEKASGELAGTMAKADLQVNRVAVSELSNATEKAQRASMKADRLFLDKLEKVGSVSSKELKILEKKSGITGLADSIKGVSDASKELKTAWKYADKAKLYTNPKNATQIEANVRHQLRLADVATAQNRLQVALERADSILKPRYKPSAGADIFKGYKVKWKLDTSAEALKFFNDKVESPAPRGAKTKVQVKTLERVKLKQVLEMKPVYAPAPKVVAAKAVIPKVSPAKLDILTLPFKKAPSQTKSVPWDRVWTQKQRERELDAVAGENADVRSTTIVKAIAGTKGFTKGSPAEWQSVDSAVKAGTAALINAETQGATKIQIEQQVKQAIRENVRVLTKAQINTITKTVTKTQTKTRTKVDITTKIPVKTKTRIPLALSFPNGLPEKDKRRLVRQSKGAISFRMGQLNEQDIWHVILKPYQSQSDYLTVIGRKPQGARIVRGPRSAYTTAQTLYGETISKQLLMDIGIMDVALTPVQGIKAVKISFTPDPKQITTGDITISKGGKVFPLKKVKDETA